jgi:helix-turn-helix protein
MAIGIAGRPPTTDLGGHSLPIPAEWLNLLAAAVAERLRDEMPERSSPWLTRRQLADYLGVPVSRVEKDRRIPAHRWQGRVLYHVDEVDAWLLEMGPR